MRGDFRPFAGHLKDKEGSTPLRKRTKSDREPNTMEVMSSKVDGDFNQTSNRSSVNVCTYLAHVLKISFLISTVFHRNHP